MQKKQYFCLKACTVSVKVCLLLASLFNILSAYRNMMARISRLRLIGLPGRGNSFLGGGALRRRGAARGGGQAAQLHGDAHALHRLRLTERHCAVLETNSCCVT